MQVATVSASIILRGTSSSAETSAPEDETASDVLKLQRTTQALEQMRQTLASSSDEVKTRAQRKLEEAKQELQMLRTSNLPPEVIARMAAELARKVASAASEFASAVATGSSPADAAPAADAGTAATGPADAAAADATADAAAGTQAAGTLTKTGSTETEPADKAAGSDTALGTGAEETDGAAQARKAYQSVVEDGAPFSGISSDDRETMQEFKAVIQGLKELLEKAMRELRQKGRQGEAQNAQSAVERADAGAGGLAASAGIFSASPTIPASIVV